MKVLTWKDLSFAVRHDGQDKTLLQDFSGSLYSGQLLAILGPSGAGKSTALDLLAKRKAPTAGTISLNGEEGFDYNDLASYVEQDDALLGVLTVRETLSYAARLQSSKVQEDAAIREAVDFTLAELGLTEVASNRIGNALQRGISGGQKRRVTLGVSSITSPSILFLDEVTSGLDSASAHKVIESVKRLAKQQDIIVIASVHQPQASTLALFDQLMVMSKGEPVFYGPVDGLPEFCSEAGFPVPMHTNASDHFIDLVNADFASDPREILDRIDRLAALVKAQCPQPGTPTKAEYQLAPGRSERRGVGKLWATFNLLARRTMINYSRNLLAYGVRLAMYLGMAIMMALIWMNMSYSQERVQDRLSVLFYSVAFLSFMSVAGIPSFLEERAVYLRETKNGLYGPAAYTLATSLVNMIFLAVCVVVFAIVSYWSMNLHGGAGHFFKFVVYTYLAVHAAEAQSVLVAALIPVFVAALAVAAFWNGFWMSVGGYFNMHLAAFWQKSFHYMDYQTYSFHLLAENEFSGVVFECSTVNGSCFCSYPSSLTASGQCAFTGQDVLSSLGYGDIPVAKWIGILVSISVVYRLLFYATLRFKARR